MANWTDRPDEPTNLIRIISLRLGLFDRGERVKVVYPSGFGGPALHEYGEVLECVGGLVRVQLIGKSTPILVDAEWVQAWEA